MDDSTSVQCAHRTPAVHSKREQMKTFMGTVGGGVCHPVRVGIVSVIHSKRREPSTAVVSGSMLQGRTTMFYYVILRLTIAGSTT